MELSTFTVGAQSPSEHVPCDTTELRRDGLGGLSERHPDYDAGCDLHSESERYFRESTASAAEVTVGLLRDRPERSVIYVALGPMTTLREACRYDGSTIRDRIGSVVCMGGQYAPYLYLGIVELVSS
jgi:hypothetical protein